MWVPEVRVETSRGTELVWLIVVPTIVWVRRASGVSELVAHWFDGLVVFRCRVGLLIWCWLRVECVFVGVVVVGRSVFEVLRWCVGWKVVFAGRF